MIRCDCCKFWQVTHPATLQRGSEVARGVCRRHSPQVVASFAISKLGQPVTQVSTLFPATREFDECGDGEPKLKVP